MTASPAGQARHRASAAVVALLGLGAVLGLQLTVNRASVERQVERQALEALRRGGYGDYVISVDGRDISLTGQAASLSELYQVKQALLSASGIRAVSTRNVTVLSTGGATAQLTPTPVSSGGPTVTVTIESATIGLSGTVPTEEARTSVVAAAEQVVGPGRVADQLTVDPATDDAVLSALISALSSLDRTATGALQLAGGVLAGYGRLPSARVRAAVGDAARGALSDPSRYVDHFTVDFDALTTNAQQVQDALDALPGVQFAVGGTTLTPADVATVDEAAGLLISHPALRIRVEAHTNDLGDSATNLRLSAHRADAVRTELLVAGVPADRVEAVGYGQTRPVVPNTSDVLRSVNERIAFVVLP